MHTISCHFIWDIFLSIFEIHHLSTSICILGRKGKGMSGAICSDHIVCLLFSDFSAGAQHDPESWAYIQHLIESGRDELTDLLPSEDDMQNILRAGNQPGPAEPEFPELSAEQRKFAVHPGMKSFYNPEFRNLEGISETGKIFIINIIF